MTDVWTTLWFARGGAFLALGTALFLAWKILRMPEGTDAMKEVAAHVREGAVAYLSQQYRVIALVFVVLFLVLVGLVKAGLLTFFVPFALVTGGFWSALAGFLGMSVATRAGSRTAAAAKEGLNRGLQAAFSAGSVMGLTVVGLGLLDLSNWYTFLTWWYSNHPVPAGMTLDQVVTATMLSSSMGASTVALFARVGGGIFTKAADVGADLVGKIEAGIPEDDPRNPAVIADNVGDNVGDVAGMGADLYESYAAAIVAAMALAVGAGLGAPGALLPLALAAVGNIASVLGISAVRSGEEASQANLLMALRRGILTSAVLMLIGSYVAVRQLLGPAHIGVYWAAISGLLAGLAIGFGTEYFTSSEYRPVKRLADTALTGPATVIIGGIAAGMLSTFLPVLLVGAAILASFYLAGGAANFEMGLYGVGISGFGLLSTLGITLATDAYGPVADNAGGNAQMTHQPALVRERTDALDSLGNTTAATGKGMAIAGAALTALALLASYRDKVLGIGATLDLSLLNPRAITGMFVGAMLPYLFSAIAMQAVGQAAGKVVEEVRRQFREIKGLMEGTAKAEYGRCVSIVTREAQRQMIFPALLAIIAPLLVGFLAGPEAVIGLLAGSLVSGFSLAIMMANAGGAWDNAKKFIEGGRHGGKGSFAHKAAVVGDTVGDPFKDTAGPSLNILLKLMATVSIVFAAAVVRFRLFAVVFFLLLAARPAAADNYTHRSSDSRESAAVVPAPEPPEYSSVDPLPVEPPPALEEDTLPLDPESALVEPAPEIPPVASVPGTDSPSREVPGTGTEPIAEPSPGAPPAEPAPATAKPSGPLPVSSDFLPKPPSVVTPAPRLEKVLLDGRLPEGAQTEGDWIWSPDPAGGTALVHSHLSAQGARSHRVTTAEPVEMPGSSMLIQQVWLDPQDPPQGIALRFKLISGEEVGVYWEGESEVFTPTDYEELWYYGMLPELGKWVSLEILAEDLGLEDGRIAGLTFSTFDGRVLWGKTLLTEAPPLEGEEEPEPAPGTDSRGREVPGADF